MCGRFVSSSPPADVAAYFGAEVVAESLGGANFNVAPTNDVFVVYDDGGLRRLDAFHWGLVPSWAKDLSVGSRMINARAETIAQKSAFKRSFTKRRCIVPADGFYEWKATPGVKRKQPMFIHRPDGEPYAFGGLWAEWRGSDRNGEPVTVRSTTIITGQPNEKMAQIHDRMPVILPPSAWDEWLDPTQNELAALGRFLVPAPSELIVFHPVSTEVNNVRNQGSHLTDKIDPDAVEPTGGEQGTLL